jgi:predicted phosphodiesterase
MNGAPRHTAGARIGLMADNHGDEILMRRALALFRTRQCTRWVHLGDICDSTQFQTARNCLKLLATPEAVAVRGNNDHSLLQSGAPRLTREVRAALARLPLVRFEAEAVLAHSLPFAASLGTRCMLADLDDEAARCFFRTFTGRHLFRGHGHHAQRVWQAEGVIHQEALAAGRRIWLDGLPPQIVTCGALSRHSAMIWDQAQRWIESVAVDQVDA